MMKKMNRAEDGKVTIVVSSCDAYSDIWEPFFLLLSRYWKNISYDVLFNTETMSPQNTHGIEINAINSNERGVSWSERLHNTVSQVKTPYVMFLLDDFFLYGHVDQKMIGELIEVMKKHEKIANISIFKTNADSIGAQEKICDGHKIFFKAKDGLYKVTAIAGLWRTDKLLEYSGYRESAWEFEINGTERSYGADDEFCYICDTDDRYFPYNYGKYGLCSGKWLRDTKKLFEKNEIKMNFNKRGFYDDYLRAAAASIYKVIDLDSSMVANTDLRGRKPVVLSATNKHPVGKFAQEYLLNRKCINFARWDVGTNYGYVFKNLKIKMTYYDDSEMVVPKEKLFGNFQYFDGKYYFLHPGPHVYISAPIPNKSIKKLHISGSLATNLDLATLKKLYYKKNADCGRREVDLCWLAYACSEKYKKEFRVLPIMIVNGKECKEQSKRGGRKGIFRYIFEVNRTTDSISYNPSRMVGYRLKGLKFSFLGSDMKKENLSVRAKTRSGESAKDGIRRKMTCIAETSIDLSFPRRKVHYVQVEGDIRTLKLRECRRIIFPSKIKRIIKVVVHRAVTRS